MVPTDYPVPAARATMGELERALQEFRSRQNGKYGVYVEDLNSGLSLNMDGSDPYYAASTTKFPVSLYAFYHAATGELDLDRTVEYLPQDRTDGTGVIQHAPFGTPYSIKQLCYHAVVDSDNVAWRMLYRTLGEPKIKAWMRSIGGQQAQSGSNYASPTDYAVYYKFLLDFVDRQPGLGGTLLEWLKSSGYYTWAPKYLPSGMRMAHKIGAWPTAINDVGIVFQKRSPYLLCLMSDLTADRRLSVAIENLAQMGNLAYRHMRQLAGKFAAVYVGGKPLKMKLPGAITGGALVVPLRDLAEALGAAVQWQGTTRTAVLTKGDTRVEVGIDKVEMQVGTSVRQLPLAPFLFESQTVVPLRATAEALGARVEWDAERYRALLSL